MVSIMTVIVSAERLRKTFANRGGEETVAVADVSFEIRKGETIGLLGGNGAGKTTTIAMLLGLLTPSVGKARIFGVDMAREPERALGRMNFSSPYVEMPHRLTVQENLNVQGLLYGVADLATRIPAICEELELTPFLDRPSGKLSAGQKTRVALAKALLNDPELLLLDEPTASMDPDMADWVRGRLEARRAATGGALLLASHNMAEVERLCDRVLILRQGLVAEEGTPADLLERFGRETLEDVFLDIARAGRAA